MYTYRYLVTCTCVPYLNGNATTIPITISCVWDRSHNLCLLYYHEQKWNDDFKNLFFFLQNFVLNKLLFKQTKFICTRIFISDNVLYRIIVFILFYYLTKCTRVMVLIDNETIEYRSVRMYVIRIMWILWR